MTFDEWWKVSGYDPYLEPFSVRRENAKAAWDHQQARIAAHNALCDEECEEKKKSRLFDCSDSWQCAVCSLRYRIEE